MREQLEAAATLFDRLALAIRGAAAVVVLLAGATGLAAVGGGWAALNALAQRPAPVLRTP